MKTLKSRLLVFVSIFCIIQIVVLCLCTKFYIDRELAKSEASLETRIDTYEEKQGSEKINNSLIKAIAYIELSRELQYNRKLAGKFLSIADDLLSGNNDIAKIKAALNNTDLVDSLNILYSKLEDLELLKTVKLDVFKTLDAEDSDSVDSKNIYTRDLIIFGHKIISLNVRDSGHLVSNAMAQNLYNEFSYKIGMAKLYIASFNNKEFFVTIDQIKELITTYCDIQNHKTIELLKYLSEISSSYDNYVSIDLQYKSLIENLSSNIK